MLLFRSITTFLRVNSEDGSAEKVKTEELIQALTFAEAENVAYNLAEKEGRFDLGEVDIDIKRVNNVAEIIGTSVLKHDNTEVKGLVHLFFENDEESGEGIYSVKVIFSEVNDKGVEKKSSEILLIPAKSNIDAAEGVRMWLSKKDNRDFVVRDVKFDKASTLLLAPPTYKSLMDNAAF